MRAVFPRDEEFSFTEVEFEVISSCPCRDVSRHSEISITMWMLEEDEGKERNSWVLSAELELNNVELFIDESSKYNDIL